MSQRFFFCRNCGEWLGNGGETIPHMQRFPNHILTEKRNVVGIAKPYERWRRVTASEFGLRTSAHYNMNHRFIGLYETLKRNSGIINLGFNFYRGIMEIFHWWSNLNLGNFYRGNK